MHKCSRFLRRVKATDPLLGSFRKQFLIVLRCEIRGRESGKETVAALFSTFVATGALTVCVAFTYLFQGIPGVGYHMIWWNTLFGWGLGFVIAWTHFLRGKWQKNPKQQ